MSDILDFVKWAYKENWEVKLVVWIFALFLAGKASYNYATKDTVQFTVDRPVEGGGESKFLIFTKTDAGTEEVFENTDSWFNLKVNSSDLQSQFKSGKKYSARVYGWRFRPFSMYRNVLSATEIGPDNAADKAEQEKQKRIQELKKELNELQK